MRVIIGSTVRSITELYDIVARTIGKDPERCHYDCTKIKCASNFANEIEEAYKEQYPNDYKMTFGMHWVCYGPKVDEALKSGTVEIEEDFISA